MDVWHLSGCGWFSLLVLVLAAAAAAAAADAAAAAAAGEAGHFHAHPELAGVLCWVDNSMTMCIAVAAAEVQFVIACRALALACGNLIARHSWSAAHCVCMNNTIHHHEPSHTTTPCTIAHHPTASYL